jgi:hypothetical protein
MTTPQSTTAGNGSSSVGGHYLVPHDHAAGTTSRQEPLYDPHNVYANGVLIALYNAATTPGSPVTVNVPDVNVYFAVQNNDPQGEDSSLGKAQADRFLAEGKITPQEYAKITAPTPPPRGNGVPPPTTQPDGQTAEPVTGDINFNTVLTPNGTTLGDMIKRVTFPRTIAQLSQSHPSVSSPQNVVNNLAALALNIVEPVKRQYPNAFLTNSFRHGASIGGGQHGTGQACDIQFRGVGAHDYFDIAVWMSKNLPYAQLLLEYLPGKTVWIHVSYEIPGLPFGGINVKPQNKLATLNGGAGGRFIPNLHKDILTSSIPNRVVAA